MFRYDFLCLEAMGKIPKKGLKYRENDMDKKESKK
jgi:hypothetical protein